MDGYGYGNLCVGLFYEHRFAMLIKETPKDRISFGTFLKQVSKLKETISQEQLEVFQGLKGLGGNSLAGNNRPVLSSLHH